MSQASRGPGKQTSPDWVAGLTEAAKPRIGYQLALLAVTMPRWVARRVESLELHDEVTAHRRVSIDFTLPAAIRSRRILVPSRTVFVPLSFVKKEPLRNFDIRDERGQALSMLSRRENGELASAALSHLAELTLGMPPEPEILEDIDALTYMSEGNSQASLERLFRQAGAARLTRYRLREDATFRGLATWLAESFLLIVPLRADRARRLIKFEYDETIGGSRRGWQRIGEPMSWQPTRIPVPVPGAGLAGSYHFEAHAPADLTFTQASLFSFATNEQLDSDQGPRPRIHLMTSRHEPELRVILRVMAPRGGTIRAALLTALFTAAVLTFGAFRLTELVKAKDGVATILVSVPAVIAAYLSRPGEHLLTTRLLFGVRLAILIAGVASFAASAVLLAGPRGVALQATWWSLDGIVWAVALALFVSFSAPRK